jgi:hypothetical protein
MERLIDPVVADLQMEYAEASKAGLIWRRRWVRVIGYAAVLYVTTRTLRVFLALTLVLTALLELPQFVSTVRFGPTKALYLIPQAIVVAVPIALTLAIAWRSPSTPRSRRFWNGAVASAAVCSAFVFVMLAWWAPMANQAYRVTVAREIGMTYRPPPGPPEMPIGELRQQMTWATTGHARWAHVNLRELEFTYYFRWAFGCASLSLVLLLVALGQRGATRRSMLLAVLPILFGYYVLMFVGRAYAIGGGALPVAVDVWMPNAITLAIAATISMFGTRRQTTS